MTHNSGLRAGAAEDERLPSLEIVRVGGFHPGPIGLGAPPSVGMAQN